jgi:hypothetical protein
VPNGKVLIVSGYGNSGVWASAELYDPATGLFTTTGSLTTARYEATASVLPGGKVLIAGGRNNSGVLASAELYDPATGLFTNTGSLSTARSYAAASVLSNGKVLIAGGDTFSSGWLASAELYDPATGLFTTTGSLSTARTAETASVLPNGKVLIAGGYGPSGFVASAELYTPTPRKPGKPGVKWSLNKKKRVVTATVTKVSGVSYKLTAKLGRKTKTGRCKAKGAKVICTLAPGRGKWKFSVTPRNAGGNGKPNVKAVKL